MSDIKVDIVNAFTREGRGGNPAGVVLNADHLSYDEKQRVARDVGASETAFVSKSDKADVKLEFFTPTREIPRCGHATVAAFSLLAPEPKKRILTFETADEKMHKVELARGNVYLEQPGPTYETLEPDEVAEAFASLGLKNSAKAKRLNPMIGNAGNRFLLLPLKSLKNLYEIVPNENAIATISERFNIIGYYPFVPVADVPGVQAAARMFAPNYGIPEESATGMAAGPLAGYLRNHVMHGKNAFTIAQGDFMPNPSPSRLDVRVKADRRYHWEVERLLVGGKASKDYTKNAYF